jgi:hypothetical protein
VRFNGPTSIQVDELVSYLATLRDPVGDSTFPKYPEEVDALGIIFGHTARADPNGSAVGKSRFFAADDRRREQGDMPDDSLLSILRGYFQSIRPATGRLLLNVNVTHGVFRNPLPLDELFARVRLNRMDRNLSPNEERLYMRDLRAVHKFLSKIRIKCKMLIARGGKVEIVDKVVAGLATKGDGRGGSNPPGFDGDRAFGGPRQVRFFLSQPVDSAQIVPGLAYDQYITVADYFLKSSPSPFELDE